jgi:hypothetical protein
LPSHCLLFACSLLAHSLLFACSVLALCVLALCLLCACSLLDLCLLLAVLACSVLALCFQCATCRLNAYTASIHDVMPGGRALALFTICSNSSHLIGVAGVGWGRWSPPAAAGVASASSLPC